VISPFAVIHCSKYALNILWCYHRYLFTCSSCKSSQNI